MKVKIIFTFLLTISIQVCINSELLTCKYDEPTWAPFIKKFYTCHPQNRDIFTKPNVEISSASSNHLYSKTNEDVKAVRILNASSESFWPRNVEKVFINLEIIQFSLLHLKEIHQFNLKPFPKLIGLNLRDNDLEIIEQDLFKFNPKLEVIWLYKNKINHIDPNVFDHLDNLVSLQLSDNNCETKFTDAYTRNDVLNVIGLVQQRKCCSETCSNEIEFNKYRKNFKNEKLKIDQKFEELERFSRIEINQTLAKEINSIKKAVKKNQVEVEAVNESISVLKESLKQCSTIDDLNKEINSIKEALRENQKDQAEAIKEAIQELKKSLNLTNYSLFGLTTIFIVISVISLIIHCCSKFKISKRNEITAISNPEYEMNQKKVTKAREASANVIQNQPEAEHIYNEVQDSST